MMWPCSRFLRLLFSHLMPFELRHCSRPETDFWPAWGHPPLQGIILPHPSTATCSGGIAWHRLDRCLQHVVGSRLDCCSVLYAGMKKTELSWTSPDQNMLGRLVLHHWKYECIIPVKHQVTYKLTLLAFRTITTNQPSYFCELLVDCQRPWDLVHLENISRNEKEQPRHGFRALKYSATAP